MLQSLKIVRKLAIWCVNPGERYSGRGGWIRTAPTWCRRGADVISFVTCVLHLLMADKRICSTRHLSPSHPMEQKCYKSRNIAVVLISGLPLALYSLPEGSIKSSSFDGGFFPNRLPDKICWWACQHQCLNDAFSNLFVAIILVGLYRMPNFTVSSPHSTYQVRFKHFYWYPNK